MTRSETYSPDEVVQDLADEYLARYRNGERPHLKEYIDRYPHLAEEIQKNFSGMAMIEDILIDDEDLHIDIVHGAPLSSMNQGDTPWQLGDYRILREIGRGGMGVVYEAEQVSLGRRVALKVLPQWFRDPKVRLRFQREAKAAAKLHHTNIVPVFGVGEHEGTPYYIMQFIQGLGLDRVVSELKRLKAAPVSTAAVGLRSDPGDPTLQDAKVTNVAQTLLNGCDVKLHADVRDVQNLVSAPASPEDLSPNTSQPILPVQGSKRWGGGTYWEGVTRVGLQVANALEYAHRHGVLHRDIKPSNLLVDDQGTVWVTDFGLAKSDDQQDLTQTGDVLGTLRYMPPEAFEGRADQRGDIYSLGLTLYELIALRPAFEGKERSVLVRQASEADPSRLSRINPKVPRDLETIVHKAIERDPSHRYASAGEMAADLQRLLNDEPIKARRASYLESYVRWARRNPVIAILGGVLTTVLLLVTAGSLIAARQFHDQAIVQKELADSRELQRRKTNEANAGLQVAEEVLRQTLYSARSNLALAAWDNNDIGQLSRLLDSLRPKPGEPDRRGWEWRYLWRLGHEDRLTLRSKDAVVSGVTFSPDGYTIATLEKNGRIKLWDRETGSLRYTLGVNTQRTSGELVEGIYALAYSPDGSRIAGPGPKNSLVLYDAVTGEIDLRLEGDPGAVQGLTWSPDGQTLVAAISAHGMRVWETRKGRLTRSFLGKHGGPVASVAFSPDGLTVATASYDKTVQIWAPAVFEPDARRVFTGHTDEVRAVAFSPDGKRIASAGLDRKVRIWEVATGREHAVCRGHTGRVISLAYSPDGERIVSGGADQTVRIWDASSGEELRTFKGHTDEVRAVAYSGDGRDIASAGADSMVKVWDATGPPRPRTLQSPSVLTYGGSVDCIAYSPDGRRFVSGHDDKALRIWELPSGRLLHLLKGHENRIRSVAFSSDGNTIASSDGRSSLLKGSQGTVRLWDTKSGEPRYVFTDHKDIVLAVLFTRDGHEVISASGDHTVKIWDPLTGKVRLSLDKHTDAVRGLALSPDGRTLASASRDHTARLWDLINGQPRAILKGHTAPLITAAFSPDGQTLATAGADRMVRLWSVKTGTFLKTLEGHLGEIDSLVFSPDGRLASSSYDKTIRIWDMAGAQNLLTLKGHAGAVVNLAFSPDGNTLASSSADRTVKLWEAAPVMVFEHEEVILNGLSPHGLESGANPRGFIPKSQGSKLRRTMPGE